MVITVLLEDTSDNKKLATAHGLSIHIATNEATILMDIGPDNSYLKNAKKLDVKIDDVDYAIISHGHYDHGSNIDKFLKKNKKADVYVSKFAFEDIAKRKGRGVLPIGIKKPKSDKRLKYVNENMDLSKNIHIFTDVKYKSTPIKDSALLVYDRGQYKPDHFRHEIYLVVEEDEKRVLFSGCSHKGIENIIKTIEKTMEKPITHVVAGFHFSHYDHFNLQEVDYLQKLGHRFYKSNREFYSCHCTGDDAFVDLKQEMKSKLTRIKTGTVINL